MCVGQKIKTYLEDNGITQTYVANKTGIPVQKLNLSLNGNRRLDFNEYELICGALSVGADKFLEPKTLERKAHYARHVKTSTLHTAETYTRNYRRSVFALDVARTCCMVMKKAVLSAEQNQPKPRQKCVLLM